MPSREERIALAAEIDRLDAEIGVLQDDKKAYFSSYREAHGKAECKAAQAAIKRRQKVAAGKGDELDELDALTDEIFLDIASRTRAARHEAA